FFFDFDRAEIRPEFRPLLDRVAQTLKADRSFKVGVSGHADETGSEEYNAALSRRRAQGVVQYLVSRGVQRSRLSIEAYGEACPAAGNESDEGRQRNRRVEFRTGVAR
ncbi:MAG: OmpA family protein, partial [Deltaproteobacteria bacterium]|nr:OmpA family protein [Deltaproteobacteria bacterium]